MTLTAAQVLGRRWIGADINRGSIALTSKRMQSLITQATSGVMDPEAPKPALKRFSVLRVNDYDLAVQHNEAVNLACELLGVSRTRSDSFFDGHLGDRLATIEPFNHPLGPLDLEEVRRDLAMRPGESRDVVLISLGKTLSSDAWLEDYNRHRNRAGGLNRIEVIELKTDARYGHLMTHEPARARVEVTRQEDQLKVRIVDFISPTIVQRLGIDLAGGAIEARLPNWRSMVDSVMIDPAYDDQVFRITLSDLPESRTDIVSGEYQLPAVEGAMSR